jgi:hypothetical protein
LRESAGNELRTLLAPITPEIFVCDYWARTPLFVKGFRDKYVGFFDAETFSGALSAPGPCPVDFLRASFDRKTDSGASASITMPGELRSSAFRASVDQAVPLYDAGATLCASQIEARVPALVPFLAAIKRQLGYPGKVSFNAYLSPPGSGFNWHFDGRIASTLQIEGTKRWRFSHRAALSWPRGNGTLRADGRARYTDDSVVAQDWEQLLPLDETATTEVLLEPGDLLILPAGFWHEACGGSGGSLALNLSFTAISYTSLVSKLLDSLLTPEAGWRGPSPVLPGSTPGEVDPTGITAITAQLARAGALLTSLSGDSAAVVRLWESFVQNPNPGLPQTAVRPISTTPVLPGQRLRARADANFYAMLAERETLLCLTVGTAPALELTGMTIPFVQRIIAEREFVASDCVGWGSAESPFTWSDVQTTLTTLKRVGFVEEAQTAQ